MPPRPSHAPTTFGLLLRQHRREAGWTQTQLANKTANVVLQRRAAGRLDENFAPLSRRAISDIESGVTREPHDATVQLLAMTLPLDDAEREAFIHAGRQPGAPRPPRQLPPRARTALIGRQREQATIRALLAKGQLVTLTGPGGCGKTRLALAVAEDLAGQYPDGVWFVDLAAIADPASVPQEVAHTLRVRAQHGKTLVETLLAWGQRRRLVLILDNCEHLSAPCADLVHLLIGGCPRLRVLATSREPLRVEGERIVPVPTLGLPPATGRPTAESVLAAEAAQLFVERARAVNPEYEATAANAAALARICRQLEGLPLAIELVAARVASLSVEQIAARLDRIFALAADGPRTAPARHRTLRAALDWSHNLLDDAERVVLRRLAAFAGSFTLEAAEALCPGDPVAQERIHALLESLIQRSLVAVEPDTGEAHRYRLLEPVRQYAAERLAASGEEDAIRRGHAAWCLARCERVDDPLDGGPEVRSWLADLDREYANLQQALSWAVVRDTDLLARLTAAIWPYYYLRGDHAFGRQLLRRALAVAAAPSRLRACLLFGLGRLAVFDEAGAERGYLDEALAIAEACGDRRLCAGIHWSLAFTAAVAGSREVASEHLAAGEALAEASGTPGLRARYRILRGYSALFQGDYAGGRALLVDAHAEALASDRPQHLCLILTRLSMANLRLGHADEARANAEAMRRAAIAIGSTGYQTIAYQRLGLAHEWAGDFAAAEAAYREALALDDEAGGNRLSRASGLIGLARVDLLRGDAAGALAWLHQAAALVAPMKHRRLRRDLIYPLGLALWHTGQRSLARAELSRALELSATGDDVALLASYLEGVAALAAAEGAAERAARWLGAMRALRERARAPRPTREANAYAATCDAATEALGEAQFARAVHDGATRAVEEMIADARAWLSA